MTELKKLDRAEAVRYLGGAKIRLNDDMNRLLDSCEREILAHAQPKYLYKIIELPSEEFIVGADISAHLTGCDRAVIMCATVGAEIDRLIRVAQVSDMARAVVLDSFASTAVEQVCSFADTEIAALFSGCYFTFRFSPGYGDYPVSLQKKFLTFLDAPRKIGLTVNENSILIPAKSVTAIAGISHDPIPKQKRGCAVCNLRESCAYRRNGEHCGF